MMEIESQAPVANSEKLKGFRKTLPIYNYRYEILSKVAKNFFLHFKLLLLSP
jgi:HrpA-like RNA helicase